MGSLISMDGLDLTLRGFLNDINQISRTKSKREELVMEGSGAFSGLGYICK